MKVSEPTRLFLREFGERIRNARIACNMSQVELGEKIGVTRYTVGALESGRAKVAVGTVFEAAMAVGLPIPGDQHDNTRAPVAVHSDAETVKLDDDYF